MRIRGFAPATPCWVELASTDPGRAQDFYASLFGWEPAGDRFKLAGRAAAGLTRTRPGRPAGWLTYLAADDLGAAVQRFAAAGGRCLSGPMDGRGGQGAVVADPSGATLGLWQAAGFAGAQVAGEPGTMAWPELLTDDVAAAEDFYGARVRLAAARRASSGSPRRTTRSPVSRPARGPPAGGARSRSPTASRRGRGLDLGAELVIAPTDMGLGSTPSCATRGAPRSR